jgi:hypothetical protein
LALTSPTSGDHSVSSSLMDSHHGVRFLGFFVFYAVHIKGKYVPSVTIIVIIVNVFTVIVIVIVFIIINTVTIVIIVFVIIITVVMGMVNLKPFSLVLGV